MKMLLALAAHILSFIGYAQPADKDSSANCVTNWKVGETKTYSIIHEKSTIDESGNNAPFRFEYQALISVLDATPYTYTIKWVFQLPDEYKTMHPRFAESLPVFDGMQMIFTTSEMGTFLELVNWEEVRDTYIRQMEISLPKKMDSTAKATLAATKKMFDSKQTVESTLIKEIQLFHLPYGYQFTTTEAGADTKLPNPFGGKPFPARQTYRLTDLDKAKDSFTLVFQLKIDKGSLHNMGTSYDLQDYTEYRFINSSGWISRLFYKRTVLIEKTRQLESYSIELKD
ncbi:MAG TPA: hypothetical protein VHC48_14345 [Puia sp.]|nr:hypothetical protein [Puia sp.]